MLVNVILSVLLLLMICGIIYKIGFNNGFEKAWNQCTNPPNTIPFKTKDIDQKINLN